MLKISMLLTRFIVLERERVSFCFVFRLFLTSCLLFASITINLPLRECEIDNIESVRLYLYVSIGNVVGFNILTTDGILLRGMI